MGVWIRLTVAPRPSMPRTGKPSTTRPTRSSCASHRALSPCAANLPGEAASGASCSREASRPLSARSSAGTLEHPDLLDYLQQRVRAHEQDG